MGAANSALHMAVSVRGSRVLRMKVAASAKDASEVRDKPQAPGDVYIGNPVSYVHGLEYPACTWTDRIVACQFRLLRTEKELFDPFVSVGTEALARRLACTKLEVPSLSEVEQTLEKLTS